MKSPKPARQAARKLRKADGNAHTLFEPYADSAAVRALDWLSPLGDQPQLRLLAGAMILAGVFTGKHKLTRAGARMLIAHEAATYVKDRVKLQIDRTRPRSASSAREKKPRKGNHHSKELTSFPSGHSAGAAAVARAFSREFPKHGGGALAAAALVAAAQVPRLSHYPSDVAAGVSIGLATESLVDAAWRHFGVWRPEQPAR